MYHFLSISNLILLVQLMNLLHEVIEQKVLEDYASFEFLRLRRCYSDTELTEYVAVYKEEDCHFLLNHFMK